MKKNGTRILLHIAGCICFLSLPFIFSPDTHFPGNPLEDPGQLRELAGYILMLGFFYLNYYLLVPRLYFPKKYGLYTVLVILAFILVTGLPNIILSFFPGPAPHDTPPHRPAPPGWPEFIFRHISHTLFLFLVVLFLSMMLRIRDQWKILREEKLSAELAYLKAQVNPHFLFNTLNSIYALSIEKSDHTPAAIVKLSGMMRYVLSESAHAHTSLENEIRYIGDYITLQKIRFGNTLHIDYRTEGNTGGLMIAPLLLIPFIENAFKYGVSPEERSRIQVHITIQIPAITMTVVNRKVQIVVPETPESGTGITNARKRLELLYPGKYTLEIDNGQEEFRVLLQILLV